MFKTNFLVAAVCAFLQLFAQVGCDKYSKEKKEIATNWQTYQSAAASGDGSTASGLLCRATLDYYERLIKLAPDAPAKECWKLRGIEMFELGGMRTKYTRKQLKGIGPAAYVALMIKDGNWATWESDWKVTDIKVGGNGTTATAKLHHPEWEAEHRRNRIATGIAGLGGRRTRGLRSTVGSSVAPPRFNLAFVKEGSAWKYDETPTLADQDVQLSEEAKEMGMSVRDYVTMMLADEDDDLKKALKIWDPMKK